MDRVSGRSGRAAVRAHSRQHAHHRPDSLRIEDERDDEIATEPIDIFERKEVILLSIGDE